MTDPAVARPWLRAIDPEAPLRLICLPYAGGGTADFRPWREALRPDVDLCPVVLPGREARLSEPPTTDLVALAEALAAALRPVVALAPYVVYGHSMGGWLGFELVRALRRLGAPLPRHLVVGARRAPDRPGHLPSLSHLPDDAFVDEMQRRYNAVPQQLRDNPDLLALFLPALRGDMVALDRYRCAPEPPLATPITALYGTSDALEDPADVRAWREHTARFAVHPIAGGHFFLRREEGMDDVVERIEPLLRSP
ncbi:MAG: alpha/beta fold hydrolase [Myxococcota bacterium]